MSPRHPLRLTRRRAVLAGLVGWGAASRRADAQAPATPWSVREVPTDEPMRHLHASGPSGLLGLGASGRLWALSPAGEAPRRLGDGIHAATPIASGHGRIAARTADGGLWVRDDADGDGRPRVLMSAGVSPHAGLLVLPLAVLAVVAPRGGPADAQDHRLVRFEPDRAAGWREVARSRDAVLPDARPLQTDLDGRRDGGHIVVLAGPDRSRYDHGVLGDAVEATRVLWLERHGLTVLRELNLAAPHVLEDIAPRPVVVPGPPAVPALLTVRSGPDGGQLALVTADPQRPQALRLAALGDTVGGHHRWLAPTTDGRHLVAVHTPHLGGVLHIYQAEGGRLTRRRLRRGVSTHRIGSRETDLAVWLQAHLLLPSQDGRTLVILNQARDWVEEAALPLTGPVIQTVAMHHASVWAGLLNDGRVVRVSP